MLFQKCVMCIELDIHVYVFICSLKYQIVSSHCLSSMLLMLVLQMKSELFSDDVNSIIGNRLEYVKPNILYTQVMKIKVLPIKLLVKTIQTGQTKALGKTTPLGWTIMMFTLRGGNNCKMFVSFKSNKAGVASGAGTANSSGSTRVHPRIVFEVVLFNL